MKVVKLLLALIKLIFFYIEDLLAFLIKKLYKIVMFVLLSLALLIYLYINHQVEKVDYINYKISKNITFSNLSDDLFKKDIIDNKLLFKLSALYFQYDKNIKAGEYSLPSNTTEFNLVKYLIEAEAVQRKVTIIEGLVYHKIIAIIANQMELDSAKFAKLYTSKKLLNKYNIPAENIEGYIFPQTYFFNWGQNEYEIIDYLINQTISNTKALLNEEKLEKYSLHEYIILASIIDAESNYPEEMFLVSSVYHNRLNKGWKLQADPTVLFILGKPQRVLFKHLEINSPYNTYKYEGLPFGPINNPGIDAIKAAINPSESTYMYFTGTGDGTGKHLFARSLIEHNKNRKQLDAARRLKRK